MDLVEHKPVNINGRVGGGDTGGLGCNDEGIRVTGVGSGGGEIPLRGDAFFPVRTTETSV